LRPATEPSRNDYPRLPIREGENVLVSFARSANAAAHKAHAAALARSPRWQALLDGLGDRLACSPQTLRLTPAARSRLA
jgi:hypothetical protein